MQRQKRARKKYKTGRKRLNTTKKGREKIKRNKENEGRERERLSWINRKTAQTQERKRDIETVEKRIRVTELEATSPGPR